MADTMAIDTVAGNYTNTIVYPWPWQPINPYWQPNPYGVTTFTWPSLDETRLSALEARIAKLERENRRLKRALGRLYIQQKEAR